MKTTKTTKTSFEKFTLTVAERQPLRNIEKTGTRDEIAIVSKTLKKGKSKLLDWHIQLEHYSLLIMKQQKQHKKRNPLETDKIPKILGNENLFIKTSKIVRRRFLLFEKNAHNGNKTIPFLYRAFSNTIWERKSHLNTKNFAKISMRLLVRSYNCLQVIGIKKLTFVDYLVMQTRNLKLPFASPIQLEKMWCYLMLLGKDFASALRFEEGETHDCLVRWLGYLWEFSETLSALYLFFEKLETQCQALC